MDDPQPAAARAARRARTSGTSSRRRRGLAAPRRLGNQDEFRTDHDGGFVGMSFVSSTRPRGSGRSTGPTTAGGVLDPPVLGSFSGDTGVFEGDDTFEGRPIRVRYIWSRVTTRTPRWEQAFSDDGGETWETNWVDGLHARGRRRMSARPARLPAPHEGDPPAASLDARRRACSSGTTSRPADAPVPLADPALARGNLRDGGRLRRRSRSPTTSAS